MTAFFISYRRKDTASTAGRLYDRLRSEFGKENLFMDVDTINAGTDFVDAIEQGIKKADVVIVVLGDKWWPGMRFRCMEQLYAQADINRQ